METDATKDEAGANAGGDCTLSRSARGLVVTQPGWDAPMSPGEVEEVFFSCDDEADVNRQ
jgi:hypothetical protein